MRYNRIWRFDSVTQTTQSFAIVSEIPNRQTEETIR
jgi:hypothetical protein